MKAISSPQVAPRPCFPLFSALLAGLLAGLVPVGAHAQFLYSNCGGAASINGYQGPAGEVVIPAMINGLPVVALSDYAFRDCSLAHSLVIPDTVTNISYSALQRSGVTNVYLGAGVSWVASSAFDACARLLNIGVSPDNAHYSSRDGVLFDKAQTRLLKFPCGHTGSYTVPESVKAIGADAFDFADSREVILPAGLGSIDSYAFSGCTGLGRLTLPAGLTNIGQFAFSQCAGLQEFSVDPANTRFSSLAGMLMDPSGTEILMFPPGKAGDFTIPSGVRRIGDKAFAEALKLTGIVFPAGLQSLGTNCFDSNLRSSQLRSVVFTDPPVEFGRAAFRNCRKLTSVQLPTTLTDIPDETFSGCAGLTNFDWPPNLRSIGSRAFDSTGLRQLSCPVKLEVIGAGAFESCPLTNIAFASSVERVDEWAFSGCKQLTQVTIPAGVTTLSDGVFASCPGLTNVSLPPGITNVGSWAFSSCSNLPALTLPAGVVSIGDGAFYWCTNLGSITLPAGMQTLGHSAFYCCKRLKEMVLPAGIQNLQMETFVGCIALETLTLPAALTNIETDVFASCRSLRQVMLPPRLTRIQFEAFGGCTNLQTVTFPEELTALEGYAFYRCSALKRITLPARVVELGDNTFGSCSNLAEVFFEGSAPDIGGADPFPGLAAGALGYYLPGTTGWSARLGSLPMVAWDPQVQTSSPQFGFQAGLFVLPVTGSSGRVVVLQASSNLANPAWVPLATNTLVNGTVSFSDPATSAYPQRFYRLRWP